MAFRFENRIDALGGVVSADGKSTDWVEGYNEAVIDASVIASDADDMIAELIDTLDDVLRGDGLHSLRRWAEDAEALLARIRGRVA